MPEISYGPPLTSVDPLPFLAWAAEREASLELRADAEESTPRRMLLQDLGWDSEVGERRLSRWRSGESSTVELATVEDALDHAGVPLANVYPAYASDDRLFDRWCAHCHETVTTDDTGICPWCESPTGDHAAPGRLYCEACDRMVFPANNGACWRCGGPLRDSMPWDLCGCGCGTMIHRFDQWGRRVKWLRGHAPRSKEGPGRPVPAEPLAEYFERCIRDLDVLEAVSRAHGIKREELVAVLGRREEELSSKWVQRALWMAGKASLGTQTGWRPDVPRFFELYPADARSKVCPDCGQGKARHAERCRRCSRRHRVAAKRAAWIGEEVLAEALKRVHAGEGYKAVAESLLPRTRYASVPSLAAALRYAIKDKRGPMAAERRA